MALSKFKFWTDAGLTAVVSGDQPVSHEIGAAADVDTVYYLGATDANSTWNLRAASDPGVDQITVTLSDSSPGGGPETTDYKLALTPAGLDSAVAGDPLNLGTVINGGVANAVAVYVRVSEPAGSGTQISFAINSCEESES